MVLSRYRSIHLVQRSLWHDAHSMRFRKTVVYGSAQMPHVGIASIGACLDSVVMVGCLNGRGFMLSNFRRGGIGI